MAEKKSGIFAVIYGPSKAGKSTATGAAGACGLFIAQGGGLLPLTNFLGLDGVESVEAKTVSDAAKIVRGSGGKYPTIVIDDFSLLIEQTVIGLENTCGFGEMWRKLRSQVLDMREAARLATSKGTHVIFNCHETPPKTSSGKFVRGGPKMPGQLPEQFSAFADVVAKVEFDETAAPWKYVLRTSPQGQYISGDRLDIFPDPSPMNLAEALRCAGYEVPRPKSLGWQEKIVAQLSDKILKDGIENWRDILRGAAEKLSGKYPLPHVRWALQDSLHRAVILNSKQNLLEDFFSDETQDDW